MLIKTNKIKALFSFVSLFFLFSCMNNSEAQLQEKKNINPHFKNTPLVSEIFSADPSAHIFEDRIYIYASHDIESSFQRRRMPKK